MLWLFWTAALVTARVDVDGDGAAEEVVVQDDGRVFVSAGARPLAEASLRTPAWRLTGAQVEAAEVGGAHRIVAVRTTSVDEDGAAGQEIALFEWSAGKLAALWDGAIGPLGEERDWSRHVALEARGIVLWEERPEVARCDGKPARLYERGWDFGKGEFRLLKRAAPAQAAGATIAAQRGVPPAGLDAATPPAVFRFQAASTMASDGGSAEGLLPPTELDDGRTATAWAEARGGAGLGEFFVARAGAANYKVVALRIVPGDAASKAAFAQANRLKTLRVSFGGQDDLVVAFPEDPAAQADRFAEPYWVTLPTPVATACVAVEILDVWPAPGKANRTAIAELAVLTDLDAGGAAALRGLAEAVAKGGEGAESAERLLAERGPLGARALLDALAAARTDDEKRRLRHALARHGDPSGAAEVLAGVAAAASEEEAARLVAGLRRMGAAALPALAAAVGDDALGERGRAAAAELLGPIADPTARAALLGACGRGSRKLRRAVALALGARDPGELAGTVTEAVDRWRAPIDDRPGLRECEADLWRAVGLLGARAAAGADRAAAAEAVAGRLGDAREYELRYRLLAAAAALLDEPPARGAIEAALAGEGEAALREVAVAALARRPADDAAAAELLVVALGDRDPGVRLAAIAGLAGRGGRETGDAALGRALAGDRWPEVRRAAAGALGARCGRAAAADALVAAADGERDDEVRATALAALVQCRDRRVAARLLAVARDTRLDAALRARAAALLGPLGDRAQVPALIELFDATRGEAFGSDAGARVAAAVAQSLGELGDSRAAAVLAEAAQDRSFPGVQAASTAALARLCPRGARPLLERLSRGEDPQVTRAARLGLQTCRGRS